MKTAIILAGGAGSRLMPITSYTSKQLLPIYDKPTIFYPMKLLELSGIENFVIVVNSHHLKQFQSCFEKLSLRCKVAFVVQSSPEGLPHGIITALEALASPPKDFLVCLGDNFIHGAGVPKLLSEALDTQGCSIFLKKVTNPEDYGVADIRDNVIEGLIEKPTSFVSEWAITGIYKFDDTFNKKFQRIRKSARNEYEITDILNLYLSERQLQYQIFGMGVSWFDTGTFENLHAAANFVRDSQARSGELIGDLMN